MADKDSKNDAITPVKLVLLRHGESQWNLENRFTGWTDVGLSPKGETEARNAGKLLAKEGYIFDAIYTSVLKRAVNTAEIVLKQLTITKPLEITKDWHLNERHYGALQGLDKKEAVKKFGEEKVHEWRRSYNIPPPKLEKNDKRYPGFDSLYKGLSEKELPLTECLKDTLERVIPYWHANIVPDLKSGRKVLVCAHGNSLRALVKHLDNVSDDEISELNIPTGIPLVYELKLMPKGVKALKHYYLGDAEEIKAAEERVRAQTGGK